ncbi:MAG: HAMP domain-containing histidine kinase, partial [Lachnospiraceae bacterium]|nr:HAMP domain-containing histidine kinase [Lachnospiraceae bacterium]
GQKTVTGALVCSSSSQWIQTGLRRVEQAMLIVELMILVVLVVVSVYVSYLMTRSVKRVSYELEKLNLGRFDGNSLPARSYNEVNEITDAASHIIERYKRMEQSQEEFVSNVSHELRTPMASIRVLSDSLIGQKGLDESVYQEFMSDISFEIDRETRIIDDLLSMAKLADSTGSVNIQTVKINDLLMDIMTMLRPLAEKRRIELIYESYRNVTADVDEVKLSQAFSNLIENGIKYNEDGGYVKVSLDADHEYFYIRVEDNGVGIPENELPEIFNRFYRVDKARSRETGGTGLGLSITKQIILLHQGTIKAESKIGVGTTFTTRIPLKHVSEGESI